MRNTMDSTTFGALALQLLGAAQVPGSALDQAIQFRDLAAALADGRLTIQPTPKSE